LSSDIFGVYYVGQISGEWEYRDAPENLKADIINVRPCKLYRVGTNVAGKIVNCFIPSAAVQPINDQTAQSFSVFVFNRIAGTNLPLPPPSSVDIFSLLSGVDLEDVVGLYLQQTQGLYFVPSSRSRQNSTISYEYELLDAKTGTPSYVQVKSGNVMLDPSDYYTSPNNYYLFSPSGYKSVSAQSHVICIERQEIEEFLQRTDHLPLNISVWLDIRNTLRGS